MAHEDDTTDPPPRASWVDFLQGVAPGERRLVSDAVVSDYQPGIEYRGGVPRKVSRPVLRLECQVCEGARNFRPERQASDDRHVTEGDVLLRYVCPDCEKQDKVFAVRIERAKHSELATLAGRPPSVIAVKIGEHPGFGERVPERVVKLFGRDRSLFLKGKQSENHGLGIGAYSYYRVVVERHWKDLLGRIVEAATETRASEDQLQRLRAAQAERSVSRSVEAAADALPETLFIGGHNPVTVLNIFLSSQLHVSADDAQCLAHAAAVREVLIALVQRITEIVDAEKRARAAIGVLLNAPKGRSGGDPGGRESTGSDD